MGEITSTIMHTKWVRLEHYLRLSGESRRTFDDLKKDGHLAQGIHWKKDPKRRVWVNTEAMEKWVEGQPLPRAG